MNNVLDEIQHYKDRSKAKRIIGERNEDHSERGEAFNAFEQALESLDPAIQLLTEAMEDTEDQSALLQKLAIQLADCYGMKGGLYRRLARYDKSMLDESIKMYDIGCEIELNKTYGVSNSYNLTNSIVVRILKDPNNLLSQREKILEAIQIVRKQVEAERKYEWWAWSDLGELNLLAGRTEEFIPAYEKFKLAGARAQDYDSTINVLRELAQALHETAPAISEGILVTVTYLNKNKPTR